ncbi:hypothetical protein L218DRAFT_1059804 [Marasmius fiardii PR-910]|nr:hypothetical protein L218DRAFT_1059804 [Marasmius fiardii PR-910]
MSYSNPLHCYVSSSQLSPYSSLGAGTIAYNEKGTRNPTFRHKLPQSLHAPSGRLGKISSRAPLSAPICFDFITQPRQGIPLKELSVIGTAGLQQMMEGANDPVPTGGEKKIIFHICWPGYEHVEWQRSVEVVTPRGHMTRSQLAGVIARSFAIYIEKTQYEATRDINWRLGPDGIRYEHLILLSLNNIYENAWQAEVAIEFR